MPHIKVQPFDTSVLDEIISKDDLMQFRALSSRKREELIGIEHKDASFLLAIKKKSDSYLIKPDPITRPVDNNIIKHSLMRLKDLAHLNLTYSNTAISANKPKLAHNAYKTISSFQNLDFSDRNIEIEVGFGSGRHLLHQAKKRRDTLFIGIEIHTPSIEQVLKQIELQGIDNIWIVNYDARLILEMLPSNSCKGVYVHFPVPWDKKPHRRVISKSFLDESVRVLDAGGKLELRTDSEKYYMYSLETFSQMAKINFNVQKNNDIEIRSKYEERWMAQNKNIYTLTLLNDQISDPKKERYEFDFGDDETLKEISLPQKAIVRDDYFIHFEDRFDIVSGGIVQRVSFGSFDRPEHKYLIENENGVSYYLEKPVNTNTNYKAHKEIRELLHG